MYNQLLSHYKKMQEKINLTLGEISKKSVLCETGNLSESLMKLLLSLIGSNNFEILEKRGESCVKFCSSGNYFSYYEEGDTEFEIITETFRSNQ